MTIFCHEHKVMKDLSSMPYRDYDLENFAHVLPVMHKYCGCFYLPLGNNFFQVIASNQIGWEHVSVSNDHRCPTFNEVVTIKEMFFNSGEIAFQIHPKKKNYVNFHNTCLHLWRPTNVNVPTPDITAVLNKYEFFSSKRVCKEGHINGTRYVAIYDPNWANWDDVFQIKQKYFGDTEVIQYHVSKATDLNNKSIILLWEHQNNFSLPPKEFVL